MCVCVGRLSLNKIVRCPFVRFTRFYRLDHETVGTSSVTLVTHALIRPIILSLLLQDPFAHLLPLLWITVLTWGINKRQGGWTWLHNNTHYKATLIQLKLANGDILEIKTKRIYFAGTSPMCL